MPDETGNGSRARQGLAIAGFVLGLLAVAAAILLALGTWRGFVRETAPELLDRPGGPWAVGCVLGLVTLGGAFGGGRLGDGPSGRPRLHRTARRTGAAVRWVAAAAPGMYLMGALPGKNCPSYRMSCQYIPGTGGALLAYLLTVALLGLLCFRLRGARSEARGARERERLRRLRKKGKGKSRAGRQR
ncbi:hypothetical protein ACSYGO_26740 [Streptomyces krungchingensis]